MGKPYKSRKVVNHAIIAALKEPKPLRPTWPQLAETLGVTLQTIHDQINRLRKKGLIPPEGEDMAPPPPFLGRKARKPRLRQPAPEPLSATEEAEALEKALSADNMTQEERRKELARIGRFGQEQNAIRAMEALNRMDEAKDRGIGPLPPMTPETRARRLGDLMRAVGQETAKAAWEVAFGSSGEGPAAGGSDLVRRSPVESGRPPGGSDGDGEHGPHSGLVAPEDEEGPSAGVGREPGSGREHGEDAPSDPPQERDSNN